YITSISFPTYVPSFDSMDLYSVLWAIISFYGPLSCSMDLYPVLCAIISFYVPSFRPMCRRYQSMDRQPRSMCQPPLPPHKKTERRSLYQSSFGPHHPGLAPPLNPQLSFNSLNMSLAASSPCFMQSGMPTPSNELPARWTPGKSSAKCLSTACNLST